MKGGESKMAMLQPEDHSHAKKSSEVRQILSKNSIDRLKSSHEVRLGLCLIELINGKMFNPFELLPRTTYRLAKKLYLKLGEASKDELIAYYETGEKTAELSSAVQRITLDPTEFRDDDLLTTQEVAWIFSVHPATVQKWIAHKRLDGIRTKKGWRIKWRSIKKFALTANSGTTLQKSKTRKAGRLLIEKDAQEVKRLRRNILWRIRKILGRDKILEKDIQFAIFHQEDCTGNQLQEHLKGSYDGNITEALRCGRLDGKKIGRNWYISFRVFILAISSVRNWVVFSKVDQTEVSFDTFVSYTQEGRFEEVQPNLSGHLSIRKEVAARANEICAEVKKEKLEEKRRIMSAMRQGQLSGNQ